MSQRRSPIWLYFEVKTTDISKAVCKLCKYEVSRGSDVPKKMTTKCLDDHLTKVHRDESKLVKDLKKKKSTDDSSMSHGSTVESSMESGIIAGSSSSITKLRTKEQRIAAFQTSIPNWVESKTKLPFHSEKAMRFHMSIFEMMMLDCQPFDIVNDRGFLRHHQLLAPNFEVCKHFINFFPINMEELV